MKFRPSPLALLFVVASVPAAVPAFAQGSPDPKAVADLAVQLTNQFRAQEGRHDVSVNGRLLGTARDFADYLAKTGRFSHEADGSNPAGRAKKHGYDYCIVSENIAYRYSSAGFTTRELAEGFVADWKNSPGHRKNMLEPDVTETAVAVAGGRPGHYYAVQLFGRPLSQSIRFSVANRSEAAIRYSMDGKSFSLGPRQTRTHQNCRSSEIELNRAGARDARASPKNGDSFVVVRSDSGALQLKTQ